MIILKISDSKTLSLSHESIPLKSFELSGQLFYKFRGIKIIFNSIGNLSLRSASVINFSIKFSWYFSVITKAKFAST